MGPMLAGRHRFAKMAHICNIQFQNKEVTSKVQFPNFSDFEVNDFYELRKLLRES